MKIFVIGSNGYVAKRLVPVFRSSGMEVKTVSSSGAGDFNLDLLDPSAFPFEEIGNNDLVIFAAAISAPDICARDHDRAWAVNVTGTSLFIESVMARGGRVIFFSSDTVYGECGKEFDENAASNPAGEYAEMKAEVERRFVGNSLFKSIRLSYVFSREDKFSKYLSACAERGEEAELFHPFYRAIVHRDDVVEGALALALHWVEFPQQSINFGGPEVLSRIDIAECLKHNALPNLRFRVTEPDEAFFKNRPRIIAMKSDILTRLLGRPRHTLVEAALLEFSKHKY